MLHVEWLRKRKDRGRELDLIFGWVIVWEVSAGSRKSLPKKLYKGKFLLASLLICRGEWMYEGKN